MIGRAVIVGGSVSGLCAAAALASRAAEVIVIERREIPDGTASVAAQGVFPHVLLGAGAAAIERLVPGFLDDLRTHGAVESAQPGTRCHWWAGNAVRDHIPDLGIHSPMATRALVETRLRTLVTRLPNVHLLAGTGATGLLADPALSVRGVRAHGSDIHADLVVDTSGRGSKTGEWLAAVGLPAPRIEQVRVGVTYLAVNIRRKPDDLDGALFAVVQNSPRLARIGVALAAEDDRWQVVLGGYFGDAAEPTPQGMLAFARSLPDPVVALLLENEWLTHPIRYQFRSSQRRRWDTARALPAGFVALGDAVASFNPLYGQGMTAAAHQAEELARCLDRFGNTPTLPRAAAKAMIRATANPWRIATGADFNYDRTVGHKSPGTNFVNRYLERVFHAAAHDEVVNAALSRVQQLLAPPPSLFAPAIMRRVHRQRTR